MKAAEFPVVAEARRAARSQLSFFNEMMAAKTAKPEPKTHNVPSQSAKASASKKSK